MKRHLFLRRANPDLVSHCRCDPADTLISAPGQLDCPWRRCGWLFICRNCSKAFTFAEEVVVDETWEAAAQRSICSRFEQPPEPGEVEERTGFMQLLLRGIQPGERYVYIDGYVIPATASGITIEGWHAAHDLDFVPQVEALRDRQVYDSLLCSRDYWQSRRIPRIDD